MRGLSTTQKYVVPLLEAFNFVGYLVEPQTWTGSEAGAVRLGQRRKVDPDARRRGLKALGIMHKFAESGIINLIYTDDQRRRVPYFQSAGYWLTAIYPDPLGNGEGMIELDDRYIKPCVVDIRQIIASRHPNKTTKTGPKRRFIPFRTALDGYFKNNSTAKSNAEVIHELGQTHADELWPRKTLTHELINEARDRAKAQASVRINPDRTTDGL